MPEGIDQRLAGDAVDLVADEDAIELGNSGIELGGVSPEPVRNGNEPGDVRPEPVRRGNELGETSPEPVRRGTRSL